LKDLIRGSGLAIHPNQIVPSLSCGNALCEEFGDRGASFHFNVIGKTSTIIVDIQNFHVRGSKGKRGWSFKRHVSHLPARGSSRFGEIVIREKDFVLFVGISNVALIAFGPLRKVSTIGRQLHVRPATGAGETKMRSGCGNGHIKQ
jgi:hypothetical protein